MPIAFWYLAKRRSAKSVFYQLCSVPIGLYLVAFVTEKLFGWGLAAHALFHFSYDTSYILTLIGLLLGLYLVIKDGHWGCLGRRPTELIFAVVLAVVPLLHLLLW